MKKNKIDYNPNKIGCWQRPSTIIKHLARIVDVLTDPQAGVGTTKSYYNSLTSKPNSWTQDSNTKKCVAPKSYKLHKLLSTITQ